MIQLHLFCFYSTVYWPCMSHPLRNGQFMTRYITVDSIACISMMTDGDGDYNGFLWLVSHYFYGSKVTSASVSVTCKQRQ